MFFTIEAFLSVRPVSKGESPRSWAGVLVGPVLWPVAGQGPGSSSGPGAMTWPFPPGLSAPPWGAGPAPALRPAVYQLSPLPSRASTQLPPSARRCSGSPCVRGAGGPWGQRLPVARPPRPRGPWPSWLPGRGLLHSASPGPFQLPESCGSCLLARSASGKDFGHLAVPRVESSEGRVSAGSPCSSQAVLQESRTNPPRLSQAATGWKGLLTLCFHNLS